MEAAFEQLRDRGPGAKDDLAEALGVSEARLRAAFEAVHDERGPGKEAIAADLAKELGVEEAKVRAALEKLREDKGDRHDALAAALAKRLNLSEAKVRDALGDLPHHGRRDRP